MLRGGLAGVPPQAYHNMRLFGNLWHQPAHHKFAGLVQVLNCVVAQPRAEAQASLAKDSTCSMAEHTWSGQPLGSRGGGADRSAGIEMLPGGLTGILSRAYHNMLLVRNLWRLPAHHKLPGLVHHRGTHRGAERGEGNLS